LITDSGKDGWYLIELLLSRGYDVAAHSRHHVSIGEFCEAAFGAHRARLDHLLSSIRCRVLTTIVPAPTLQASVPTWWHPKITFSDLVAMMVLERSGALSSCCKRSVGIIGDSVARQMKD
jgi:hypothetical protein